MGKMALTKPVGKKKILWRAQFHMYIYIYLVGEKLHNICSISLISTLVSTYAFKCVLRESSGLSLFKCAFESDRI